MSLQHEGPSLIKVSRSIETQTDISIQEQISQFSSNMNPPSLAATGEVPIMSKLPMVYFFVKQVLVENHEPACKFTLPFLNWCKYSNILVDCSTQTDISEAQFVNMCNQSVPLYNENFYPDPITNYNNNITNVPTMPNNSVNNNIPINHLNHNIPINYLNNNFPINYLNNNNFPINYLNNNLNAGISTYYANSNNPWLPYIGNSHTTVFNDMFFLYNGFYYKSRVTTQVVPVCPANTILYPYPHHLTNLSPLNHFISDQSIYNVYDVPEQVMDQHFDNENNNADYQLNKENIKQESNASPNLASMKKSIEDQKNEVNDFTIKLQNNKIEREDGPLKFCKFCRSNREAKSVYESHQLHAPQEDGSKIVTCPILRSYICRMCNATGDLAHTESHCPKNPNVGVSTAKLVTRTAYNSSGKPRRAIS